jgi:hypothetical protein
VKAVFFSVVDVGRGWKRRNEGLLQCSSLEVRAGFALVVKAVSNGQIQKNVGGRIRIWCKELGRITVRF